jgi:hypothetical protein
VNGGLSFVDNQTPRHEACFHKSVANHCFSISLEFFYPYGGTVTDEEIARLRAHDSNINRYRRLLKTNLSDLERRYLEQRLSEERSAVENLAHPPPTPRTEHGRSV